MNKKIFIFFSSLFFLAIATSCNNINNDDDELRTIPVTNNPLVVPDTAPSLPGISSGPYAR